MEKDTEAQHALGNMACSEDLSNECIKTLERYLCAVYGKNKLNVRMQIFLEKYRPKCGEERLRCAKKLDGSIMPPCGNVLLQKLKRTHLITRWMSATVSQPPDEYPKNSGWVFEDQSYIIKWFEGSTAPKALDVVYDENIQAPDNFNSENDAYDYADNSDEDE